MASKDARLSKFEADFKQQQNEMNNKIDTVSKAITDRIMGTLPSDTKPKIKPEPPQPEEPKPTLEDEFQDLHINLPVLEVLAHALIYNAILDKYAESLELGKNGTEFVQGEMPVKREDPGLFTLPCRLGDSKPFDTLANLGSCVNIIPLYVFKKLNIGLLEETDHVFGLADGTKSYPKDPKTPLVVGRGFLATANAVIDCRMAKIAVGEGLTRSVFGVKGVNIREEETPYWTTLEKRESFKLRPYSEGIGAIPINLKSNMWESENLIENPINWDKPPKNRDGAWHAKIRLIDPDGVEFTKTLQSIPTTRKLSEKESPKDIIDLDHFYDT
ncbi:hypothetical protein Tco_1364956 [Tanacetum coccineum]